VAPNNPAKKENVFLRMVLIELRKYKLIINYEEYLITIISLAVITGTPTLFIKTLEILF